MAEEPKQNTAAAVAMVVGLSLAAVIVLLAWGLPSVTPEDRAVPVAPLALGLQAPATDVMANVEAFHDLLLIIITGIVLVVLGLLIWVVWRYRAAANPVPSRVTHNTLVEVIWTAVPVLILIVIAIPSFKLMYYMDEVPEADLKVEVTGYAAWYWGYRYFDADNAEMAGLDFTSHLKPEDRLDPTRDDVRLLTTYDPTTEAPRPVVLPTQRNIQFRVTADIVLHSFAVPAFGIKRDAVPGRDNLTWARIERVGRYFGQCSELCGAGHAFMPIEVWAVPGDVFDQWAAIAADPQGGLDAANQFVWETGVLGIVPYSGGVGAEQRASLEATPAAVRAQ